MSRVLLHLTLAASMLIFLTGCADWQARLSDLAHRNVAAQGVSQPEAKRPECRLKEATGVQEGDRLDVAVLKVNAALNRQHARGIRCADFYETLLDPAK